MNVGNDFVADVFLSNEFVPNELVLQNKFFTAQCAADEILAAVGLKMRTIANSGDSLLHNMPQNKLKSGGQT